MPTTVAYWPFSDTWEPDAPVLGGYEQGDSRVSLAGCGGLEN